MDMRVDVDLDLDGAGVRDFVIFLKTTSKLSKII